MCRLSASRTSRRRSKKAPFIAVSGDRGREVAFASAFARERKVKVISRFGHLNDVDSLPVIGIYWSRNGRARTMTLAQI